MAKGEMKKRIRGKGCLPWIAVFIAWLAWMNLVALKNPWSDEEAIELFYENRGAFELVRNASLKLVKNEVYVQHLGNEAMIAEFPAEAAEAARLLQASGVSKFSAYGDCFYFYLADVLEDWKVITSKSIEWCSALPHSDLEYPNPNRVYLVGEDIDTDRFFRRPECFPINADVYRPIEANWYLVNDLYNGRHGTTNRTRRCEGFSVDPALLVLPPDPDR